MYMKRGFPGLRQAGTGRKKIFRMDFQKDPVSCILFMEAKAKEVSR